MGRKRSGTRTATLLAAAALAFSVPALASDPPGRVVSLNLCTDQMAMLVAGKGQLYSVSDLASDPQSSMMVDEARDYVVNHGLAEEVFLMRPDLVLAGTYTTRATVELLRRLGIRVEEFAPAESIGDIRAGFRRMGDLLGHRARADEIVSAMDRDLAALEAGKRPDLTIAAWEPNSYTSGTGTLVDAVIQAAGLTNIASKLGLTGMAKLPLETLILSRPDLVAGENPHYAAHSVAQDNLVHPAFREAVRQAVPVALPARYTICGGPFTVDAVRMLQQAASKIPERR
ncbi:ABC transporter substrate-binding protein [Mesorhizobium sp. SP-1A]|uniref:ABC transporter substrate-binding protein n=1 Tax=Mesorhizobium sp. SP-1A TaxID=3077840 RepID=UPI0028F6FAB6|nr:ABC transporter substrate-binding protein [Mesorhizobium sp. SP-1A]